MNKKTVLLQTGLHGAAVDFDTTTLSLRQLHAVFTVTGLLKNLAFLSTFSIRITYISYFESQ